MFLCVSRKIKNIKKFANHYFVNNYSNLNIIRFCTDNYIILFTNYARDNNVTKFDEEDIFEQVDYYCR